MRRRIIWIIGFWAALGLAPAQAVSPSSAPLPARNPDKTTGKPLQTLLREIAIPSGVRFEVAPEVARDLIAAQPEGTAWPLIIRDLLRGYNYTGTWSASGKLTEVHVTGRNGDGREPAASAPTPGELFSYRPPAKSLPAQLQIYAPGSVYPIKVPVDRLKHMKKGERVYASLPDGRYQLVHDNAWKHGNGDTTWVGYLEGPQGRYRAVLTLGDDAVVGQMLTPAGLYRFESDGAGEWLVDMNASGLERGGFEGDEGNAPGIVIGNAGLLPPSPATSAARSRQPSAMDLARPVGAAVTEDGKSIIDVLLLYTAGMANAQVSTRLNQLVSLANQALVDSRVNAVFRLAASRQVTYPDRTDNSVALDKLTYFRGGFRNVPNMRARYGADVVMLIRPFRPVSQGGGCGIAWVNGSENGDLTADQAFGVVGYGAAGGYYCSDYALAHEIGHIMGGAHDRAHASVPGKFPYSYGYGVPGRFGDIMSYYDPEVGVYSNPGLNVCDASPCGIPIDQPQAANVALTLNKTAATVSGFAGVAVGQ